jgi:hypothetical protein
MTTGVELKNKYEFMTTGRQIVLLEEVREKITFLDK